MPEWAELHLAARFVNNVCSDTLFAGPVVKSEVTKNPSVDWPSDGYRISAESRGKELRLTLRDVERQEHSTALLFRFGMSGSFQLTPDDSLPKHSHLRFYAAAAAGGGSSKAPPRRQVLSFVDARRFGSWSESADWGEGRGPDPVLEHKLFRGAVLANLELACFGKAVCEVMLDQRFFNGIGNYLRAEILYRAKVRPFDAARTVLAGLQEGKVDDPSRDLLELCKVVPAEVLSLGGGGGYGPGSDYTKFSEWLQCYNKEGMSSMVDSKGRTIWFEGPPGELAPKGARCRTKSKRSKKGNKKAGGAKRSKASSKSTN